MFFIDVVIIYLILLYYNASHRSVLIQIHTLKASLFLQLYSNFLILSNTQWTSLSSAAICVYIQHYYHKGEFGGD